MYVCAFVYVLTYVWHASLPHRAYTIYGNGRRKKSLSELRLDKCCTIKYADSGSSCSCSLKGVELNMGTGERRLQAVQAALNYSNWQMLNSCQLGGLFVKSHLLPLN